MKAGYVSDQSIQCPQRPCGCVFCYFRLREHFAVNITKYVEEKKEQWIKVWFGLVTFIRRIGGLFNNGSIFYVAGAKE